MQFRGQHPGGIGVPAVGMAFPGYVGNPQLGLGNSEMTWYSYPFSVKLQFLLWFVLFSFRLCVLCEHNYYPKKWLIDTSCGE